MELPYQKVVELPSHEVVVLPYSEVVEFANHCVIKLPYREVVGFPYHEVVELLHYSREVPSSFIKLEFTNFNMKNKNPVTKN